MSRHETFCYPPHFDYQALLNGRKVTVEHYQKLLTTCFKDSKLDLAVYSHEVFRAFESLRLDLIATCLHQEDWQPVLWLLPISL
jgi:hypothetical protein